MAMADDLRLRWANAKVVDPVRRGATMHWMEGLFSQNFRYWVVLSYQYLPAGLVVEYPATPSTLLQRRPQRPGALFSGRFPGSVFGFCFCVAAPLLSRIIKRGARCRIFQVEYRSQPLSRSVDWPNAPEFLQAQEGRWVDRLTAPGFGQIREDPWTFLLAKMLEQLWLPNSVQRRG